MGFFYNEFIINEDLRREKKCMKIKKLLATGLATAMAVTTLAGCGSTADNNASQSAGTDSAAGSTQAAASNDDVTTITIYAYNNSTTEAAEKVAAAVSEITEPAIGVKVNLLTGVSSEQLNLALASGEDLDLFFAMPWQVSMSTMATTNQIVAMDDLLAEYAPDVLSGISEDDWRCSTVSGSIYGVPMNKDKAQGRGFEMVKSIADELGIDYSTPWTYEDLDANLRKVKEAYPDMYPLVPNGGTMIYPAWACDVLSDDLGVLENALSDSTQVVNFYDTDSFKEYCKWVYQWAQEGLMMPDAVNTTEGYQEFFNSGVGFGTFTSFKAGFEAEETRKCGKDIVVVQMENGAPHSTTSMVNASWCIANNSKNPEKAMQMLNLMYTNPEVSNLLVNGIEGDNWVFADESKGVITYPEGVDSSNTSYSSVGWAWPNEQITYVWEGDDPDVWEQLGEFNKNAQPSPAKGFVWDNSEVLNEVTACNNVVEKYRAGLLTGCLDPETAIPQMNQELDAAGINTIIEAKQAQLDAWLAEQN